MISRKKCNKRHQPFMWKNTRLLKDIKEDLSKWRHDMFLDKLIRFSITDLLK